MKKIVSISLYQHRDQNVLVEITRTKKSGSSRVYEATKLSLARLTELLNLYDRFFSVNVESPGRWLDITYWTPLSYRS